ncbi:hypothetical protein SAMD00023353_9600310 [Rosellinia necatrix]|uniref:Uncharacterized protein n=1 Tax=Rosellinia necatrix TaxID=77044 RepID=A0A1W2TVL3_ROSNE|nr:hypothetical protein SAMD00023353_9600310 [Rosellinia necatrix]
MFSLWKNQGVTEVPDEFPPIQDVIKVFWGEQSPRKKLFNNQPSQDLDMSAYAEYFRRQWYAVAADADGRYVATQKVDDIFQIVRHLLQGHHRSSIVSRLNKTNPTATESACNSAVDLAVRLLLMLKVGVIKHQASPRFCLNWEKGNLQSFVREQFNQLPVLDSHHVRLPKSFDAWNISTIGGLKIEFTDYLADHLLLVDDDTTILLFHHASFLECQVETLYPDGLVDETLRTLALLFPQSEFSSRTRGSKTKREWLRNLRLVSNPCLIDQRVALCGDLRAEDRQIERFTFWRDRLIILKQVYDDATPRTVNQWWHDRRNGERWCTFWVAALVLIITTTLGLIQCIEGALQVYKSFYPTVT